MNRRHHLKRLIQGRSLSQSKERQILPRLRSKALPFCLAAGTVVLSLCGALPLLLASIVGGVTVASLLTQQSTDSVLNRFAASTGGWNVLFIAVAAAFGLSLLSQGQPAYALFDGARDAASSGIGTYIGEEESMSLIDTITFGMWALAAVGGIATIAGGAIQNVLVLVGGLVLFFGMAVLIGVLEFTDTLLFSS